MNKEILVALLAVGFVFAGVVSVSADAVTWTLIRTSSVAWHTPGADGKIGTGDDGTTKCNLSSAVDCVTIGSPSLGAYSFAKLTFQMASSCAAASGTAQIGQSCTTNLDCGLLTTRCVPCSPNPGYTYFGNNPLGGIKGTGTFTVKACENKAPVTAVSIGMSEWVTDVGGSCMTMNTFNSSSGCAGPYSTNFDLRLWTNSVLPNCGTNAGLMQFLSLAGQIFAHGSYGGGAVCGYDSTERAAIGSDAGLVSGDYLAIMCGSGTLPIGLAATCIRGAPWVAKVVAKTKGNLASACPVTPCPNGGGGCMGATAEQVE